MLKEYASDRGLRVGIWLEHLEEAAFLHEQRDLLVADSHRDWMASEAVENRMESHLDALSLGGGNLGAGTVMAHYRERLVHGEPGEAHAAMRALCRSGSEMDAFQALMGAEEPDSDRDRAIWEGFREDMPEAWGAEFVAACVAKGGAWPARAVELFRFRRMNLDGDSLSLLHRKGGLPFGGFAGYFGAMRARRYQKDIFAKALHDSDDAVGEAAAIALLRMGDSRIQSELTRLAATRAWAIPLLGLSGMPSDQRTLLELASCPSPRPEALLALGLSGRGDATGILAPHLNSDATRIPAANALYLLTGMDPQAAIDGGYEAWRRTHSALPPSLRLRLGRPILPSLLLEGLAAPGPADARNWLALEAAVRYGMDIGLEPGMAVAKQKTALRDFRARLPQGASSHQAGRWYYAGNLQA